MVNCKWHGKFLPCPREALWKSLVRCVEDDRLVGRGGGRAAGRRLSGQNHWRLDSGGGGRAGMPVVAVRAVHFLFFPRSQPDGAGRREPSHCAWPRQGG